MHERYRIELREDESKNGLLAVVHRPGPPEAWERAHQFADANPSRIVIIIDTLTGSILGRLQPGQGQLA